MKILASRINSSIISSQNCILSSKLSKNEKFHNWIKSIIICICSQHKNKKEKLLAKKIDIDVVGGDILKVYSRVGHCLM